jgi:transcriptional/translational regulatory protein YebC/TACO1
MQVLSDNVNRAFAETKLAVNKAGGKMAETGSVLFNFERKGIIVLDCENDREEEVFEVATEAGADDITPRDDELPGFAVITDVPAFIDCQRALVDAGFKINPDETGLKVGLCRLTASRTPIESADGSST